MATEDKMKKTTGREFRLVQATKNQIDQILACRRIEADKLGDGTTRRKSFAVEQLVALEYHYAQCRYLRGQRRLQVARQLQLTEAQVKIWFQNRRAKETRSKATATNRTTTTDGPHRDVARLDSHVSRC